MVKTFATAMVRRERLAARTVLLHLQKAATRSGCWRADCVHKVAAAMPKRNPHSMGRLCKGALTVREIA